MMNTAPWFVVVIMLNTPLSCYGLLGVQTTSQFTMHFYSRGTPVKINTQEFTKLLKRIAEAWNEGDPKKAADCYTEDAIYTEPPANQVYVGRKALYEFFGGDKKPAPRMKMGWHHLAFDEGEQVGFGEYTFEGKNRYHGIVIVKIKEGKVSNWREYQYNSSLEWRDFVGKNRF
jgi:hypothetical protein